MIVCAALKLIKKNTLDETVIPCIRHGDGFFILKQLNINTAELETVKQGFIDNRGQFYDRKEALEKAIALGQLSQTTIWHKADRHETELFSEDLY